MAPINNTFLTGIDTSQFTLDGQDQIINATHDGDGTVRLCVSTGIPKQGQVTNFKVINGGVGVNNWSYTVPNGKTFYALTMSISNGGALSEGQLIEVDDGATTIQFYDLSVPAGASFTFSAPYPLLIATSGQVIKATGGADTRVSVQGYEEFGLTS